MLEEKESEPSDHCIDYAKPVRASTHAWCSSETDARAI